MKTSKSIVIGAVLSALMLGLYFDPYTGWLLRCQIPTPGASTLYDLRWHPSPAEAARLPDDYQTQLALALAVKPGLHWYEVRPRILSQLESLESKFAAQPSLYAHLMSFACSDIPIAARLEVEKMEGLAPPRAKIGPRDLSEDEKQDLVKSASWGLQGERLDPDNAFFPFMRAGVLFTLHQDDAGLQEVLAAGSKARWDDYASELDRSVDESAQRELGRQPWWIVAGRQGSPSSSEIGQQDSTAYFVTYLATKAENSGQAAQTLTIRHALLRYGGLMRAGARSWTDEMVGEHIIHIAESYFPHQVSGSLRPADFASMTPDQQDAWRLKVIQSHWLDLGHPEEAQFVAAQYAAVRSSHTVRSYLNPSTGVSMYGLRFLELRHLIELWFLSMALLSNASFVMAMILLGFILRRPRTSHRRFLIAAWSLLLALLIWAAIARWTPFYDLRSIIRPGPWDPGLGPGPAAAALAFMFKETWTYVLFTVLASTFVPAAALIFRFAAVLAAPRDEAHVSRRSAIPLLVAIVLAYAGSIALLARAEDHATRQFRLLSANECQYYAHLEGTEWPGVVR